MDVRSIEAVEPIIEHNGTVPVWWLVSPRERSPINASLPVRVPIRLATNGPLSENGVAVCWPKKSATRTQKRSARISESATTTRFAGPSVCALCSGNPAGRVCPVANGGEGH